MKTIQNILPLILLSVISFDLFSQNEKPSAATFEIANVSVEGNTYSETKAIIARSGLEVGKSIQIPSNAIPKAMKALWKMELFSDVQILKERTTEDLVFLKIIVKEQARLGALHIKGVKKTQLEALEQLVRPHLQKGAALTNHKKKTAIKLIQQYYTEKGFADATVRSEQIPSIRLAHGHDLTLVVDPGKRSKIADIVIRGNHAVKTSKILRLMGSKKKQNIFKPSKVIAEQLAADQQMIVQHYHSLGYRDARIKSDSLWQEADGDWRVQLEIEEGEQFFIGTINWLGNSLYSSSDLQKVFGLKEGDVFNPTLVESRLRFDEQGRDISSLYLDRGYLFFQIEALEKAIRGQVIDLEIRILEGPQATVDQVVIKGNTVTNEEVIRRELRTKPGEKFSRAAIIRSQRELINMGYFNPETITINTPVDAEKGTVDIEYTVEEKNSDQFELAASWGGPDIGLTGTAGVSFNNFSLRNILKPSTWNPLPSGDGQSLSLRAQSNGKDYQSYNISFTEPWLGGKKPQSLSVSAFYNIDQEDGISSEIDGERFTVLGAQASLSRRLQWPDDNFISTTGINFHRYRLTDWGDDLITPDEGGSIRNGTFNKISINQTIARSTLNHNFFPTSGSLISLAMEFTPPYSLLKKEQTEDPTLEEKYKWIEYHKWRFNAEWYKRVVGKLTLKAAAKIGALGAYNSSLGVSPFERFQLGGNGLSSFNNGYSGTDIISLRGYEVEDLENNYRNGELAATPLFNKFTLELRYPVLTNPAANIYVLGFLEGGNSYSSVKTYNPFDLKRSAGLGLRAQIPMLGLVGFDYGIGFDKDGPKTLKNFGQFSLIFGFEPE